MEEALHELLGDEVYGDLVGELAVEPSDKAADLHAFREGGAEEGGVGVGFVEVFADDVAVGDDEAVFLNEGGDFGGGIELQVLVAALPNLFDAHLEGEVLLGEDDADLAGVGREGEVVEEAHGGVMASGVGGVYGGWGMRASD